VKGSRASPDWIESDGFDGLHHYHAVTENRGYYQACVREVGLQGRMGCAK